MSKSLSIFIECVYEKPVQRIISYFLHDINVNYVSSPDNANVIVKSIDNKHRNIVLKENQKIIYWSGESFPCKDDDMVSGFYIYSFKNDTTYEDNCYIWYPYVLDSPYWDIVPLKGICDREYKMCYCSCRARKEREELFRIMYEVGKGMNYEVHSLGVCNGGIPMSHKKLPSVLKTSWDSFSLIEAYNKYDFVLAVENTMHEGYVTEKIMNVFASGAIPVFWGDSKTVEGIFNKEAYIDVSDFASFEQCARYVMGLPSDKIRNMRSQKIYKNDIWIRSPEYLREGSEKLKNYLFKSNSVSIPPSPSSDTSPSSSTSSSKQSHIPMIDHIIYINLQHRTDRRKHIEKEINKIDQGLSKTSRFNAIYYDKCKKENVSGAVGATMSHIGCLKLAWEKGYENTLILEDDFAFLGDINLLLERLEYFSKSPYNNIYNLLLFGTNTRYIANIGDRYVYLPVQSQTASGYVVNRRFLEQLIKTFENSLQRLIETEDRERYALDMEGWKSFQYPVEKNTRVFTFNDVSGYRVGYQIASYSDIERAKVYYGGV